MEAASAPISTPSITCPWCGRTSYNLNDCKRLWCNACKADHDELRFKQVVFLTGLKSQSGYACLRPLLKKPGRWAGLMGLIHTTAIIEGAFGDQMSIYDRWCYHEPEKALTALVLWEGEGEPRGWHRHPSSGRRVNLETGEITIRH